VLVLAELVRYEGGRMPNAQVADGQTLNPSPSARIPEADRACRFYRSGDQAGPLRAVEEFLIRGVKYAFPVDRGEA
jgi:hypothetical protein